MKTDELMAAAQKAAIIDRVEKFGVAMIQSITVQANMHGRNPDGQQGTIALRVDESDPRYAALEAMLRDEAATQKTAAEDALAAVGITPTVDQAALDAHAAHSLAGKQEHDALVERNRQKKILADALRAEKG